MNKYIRLENTIRELKINEEDSRNNVINYFYCEFHYEDNTVRSLFEEEDLKKYKQADTIEELCDEFVFEGVDGKPFVCDNFSELIYWFNHSKEQQYKTRNCYGAIWTNKGLIYVSKMNDKGEFELLPY